MKKLLWIVGVVVLIIIVYFIATSGGNKANAPVTPAENSQISTNTPETAQVKVIPMTGKTYTLADVAKHNSETDCWMAISGSVIDVTQYIASGQHNSKILQGCGKDATQLFNSIPNHDNSKAAANIQSFTIGVLAK